MTGKIPLVLIPGLLCDSELWKCQTRWLSEIADITIGDTLKDDSILGMAERILSAAPERFALAGLSMGGYVSMEIMRQAPGRVTKLTLLDTGPRADTAEQTERRRGLIRLAEIGKFKGVTPKLLPLLVHEDRQQDGPLTKAIMGMAERVGQAGFFRQ